MKFSRRVLFFVLIVSIAVLGIVPVSAQDGECDEPITVGGSLSLTGFLAPTAIIHEITGRAYVDFLNENGGLLGCPVEWIVLDDESSPDLSASLYEQLITEDEVDLLMGPYGTGNITAAMNVAARHQMVFPQHTASLTYVYDYEWQFPSWFIGLNTHITTPRIIFDAVTSVEDPPETIAFVVNQFPGTQNLAFGNDVLEPGGAVLIAEEEYGMEVVVNVEFPTGTTDFGPIAQQIADADPDFLWVGAIGVDANNLLEALDALDYRPRGHFYLWPAPGPLLALGDLSDGAMSVTLFEPFEPFLSNHQADIMVERFTAAAEEAGIPFTVAETQAAASWSAWQVLTAGVEGAGSLDQEAIANWLLTHPVETVTGTLEFNPDENNYGEDLTKIKQIQDGQWVVVWPPEYATEGFEVVYPVR